MWGGTLPPHPGTIELFLGGDNIRIKAVEKSDTFNVNLIIYYIQDPDDSNLRPVPVPGLGTEALDDSA